MVFEGKSPQAETYRWTGTRNQYPHTNAHTDTPPHTHTHLHTQTYSHLRHRQNEPKRGKEGIPCLLSKTQYQEAKAPAKVISPVRSGRRTKFHLTSISWSNSYFCPSYRLKADADAYNICGGRIKRPMEKKHITCMRNLMCDVLFLDWI